MDEPTNHLDIPSKRVLKEALQHFEGTLILVSHDRDFLQGLTNQVYEFREGQIKPYLGDIDFYLEQREVADFRAIERSTPEATPEAKPSEATSQVQDPGVRKEKRSLKNRLGALEGDIASLEKEIGEMDYKLHMDYDSTASDPSFFDRYQDCKGRLEGLMSNWETLAARLEELDQD